ncbi:hypothetical protein [Fimbriimonas ginsengisoli]|uniref:Uncharacterized protein n=1 Tax=Fimbriimonas ginsengisoli Gsoil 348 TaxID=661478 RepID=A0A068NWD3_FIMGI|nr:hypothetical protein [Fimbriimonas ginsengisoli]AIE87045.1 hypothetical protein OP10G_3677 [Fimbriimonas ginsengisoli Gsoil 348]
MNPTGNPVLYILAVVFVGIMVLFGLSLLFVKAENIERNLLVGVLTLLCAGIAGVMLAELPVASQTGAVLTSITLVSIFGYVVGRIIDYFLGPVEESEEDIKHPTLGADLAD